MARPRRGTERTHVPLCIRVSTQAADQLARWSLRRDESIYALAGRIVDRTVLQWITTHEADTRYPHEQSTLSRVLSESPSSRARQTVR